MLERELAQSGRSAQRVPKVSAGVSPSLSLSLRRDGTEVGRKTGFRLMKMFP